ncbi:MAG TPA: hypothetical protein VFQ61_39345, partial [Polyangiaceae bacterium]|nr:hypothetical protein [Polyangiaceae bacterium]
DALASAKRERDGAMVPLVRRETVLLEATREPLRSEPPAWAGYFGLVGLALGGAFAGLGQLGARVKAARVAFALSSGLLGLVTGLLGTIFMVFWLFTKHWSAYRNENTLVCPPWALLLPVLCVGLALGRERASRRSLLVFQASAVSSIIALLLALIPHFGQDNTRIAALLGPVWLGLYAGACRLMRLPLWPPAKPARAKQLEPSKS